MVLYSEYSQQAIRSMGLELRDPIPYSLGLLTQTHIGSSPPTGLLQTPQPQSKSTDLN